MKILLVEDDAALRRNIAQMLQSEGHETIGCGSGEEGLYYAAQNACDLVVLDRMLPDMDGLTLLKKARRAGVAAPVLMLTAMNAVGDRVDGLDAGADDYLSKPFDMRELLARVRALVRRPAPIESAEAMTFGDLAYSPAGLTLSGPGGETVLSKTLAAMLELFLRNSAPALSRATLFSRVWGPDSDVGDNIIDTYISLLRRRLKSVGSSVQILTNRGVGYSLKESPEESREAKC